MANAYGEVKMKSLTVQDGLAGESVYKIYKSKWNVIWVATSNGVSSYDGGKVKTYRVSEKRSENRIIDIVQDDNGYIWVASDYGVFKVDGREKWLVKALPGIKKQVSCIRIVGKTIYCGTENGLFVAKTKPGNSDLRQVWLNKNHLQGNNKVSDIVVDGERLWVLCEQELYRYDVKSGKVTNMKLRQRLRMNNRMNYIAKHGDKIIIGTYNDGLLLYDVKNNVIGSYLDVNCRVITCLSVEKNRLFVGTDGSGLHVISLTDDRIIQTYNTSADSKYTLKDNTVYAYYHDLSGVNFFGYYRQGMQHNFYSKDLFKAYVVPGVFDSRGKNIRSICIDGKVKVLGSRGGLWYVDEEKGFSKFFTPEELGGSIVTNVVKYAGQYYCSTFNGGVMRIDPTTMTTSRFGVSEALRSSSFGCLKVSPDNELWMAGNAGVYIYNASTDSERHFDYRNSKLPDAYCNNLLFDRQGRCWISSAKGMSLYDPVTKVIHYSGFPEGFFNAQSEMGGAIGDGDDLLFWSFDGLYITNEEMTQFAEIKASSPAATDCVAQAIYDKRHGNYWIATETGMFRYDRQIKGFRKFSDEAGLMTHEFSNRAIAITDDNTLWTGTMHGLYSCDLDEAQNFHLRKARVVLDDIKVDGAAADDENITMMYRQNTVKLEYHWGTQKLYFTPSLQNYCNQTNLCFEYRYGSEGEWRNINRQGEICVEGLPIGLTVMEIRLAGSPYVTTYHFYVYPSGWFIFELIGIAVFACVIALLYRQKRLVRRQQEETERVQRELEEAKRKYSRVNTNEDEQQRLWRRLEDYMRNDKPFLVNDLKLSDVAVHLGVSTVKLSQLFSMFVHNNYYDYINQGRLEEFKERLNDKRYANYTLLALAEECGFKRSSFFTTFKKVEGVTPTEYVKRLQEQK